MGPHPERSRVIPPCPQCGQLTHGIVGTANGGVREIKAIVERICGPVAEWPSTPTTHVRFRLANPLPIKTLMALSEALGTDEIDFNFGDSGSPHYSELTPGEPGHPGWVEVKWPIKSQKPPEAPKTGMKMGPDFGDDET